MSTTTQRPTPETDAAAFDIPHHGGDGAGSRVAVVHYQVARRLERERDEALALLAQYSAEREHNAMQALAYKAERDEAIATCQELVTDSNAVTLAATVVRLERERNEAREASHPPCHRHAQGWLQEDAGQVCQRGGPGAEMTVDPDTSYDHLLKGQPKPTGEQLAWVFSFLADLCQSEGQSYGFVLQRMYGYPSREKLIAAGPGMFVTNTINCAIENPDVVKAVGECYT